MDQDKWGKVDGVDLDANFERLRLRFNEGKKEAALHALAHAYYFKVMPPDWVLEHVASGYGRWVSAEVRTLDEALGVARPKGFRIDAARKSLELGGAILIDVNKRLECESYDDEVFAEVGKIWGVGKTAAKDIYYQEMEYLKINHSESHSRIMSSRKNAKNPAGSKTSKR